MLAATTLVKLGATGLMAATVPLALVWISSDANKYRKLVWTIVFITFDLIVFGAFTRLTGSGLGCPAWLGAREDQLLKPQAAGAGRAPLGAVRPLAILSAVVLALQIALGGWVSTNYATLACNDFPLCGGQLVPAMDFEHGFTLWRELGRDAAGNYLPFSALTAIHWVHRNFAVVVVLVLGWTAWRAWRVPGLQGTAR